MMTENSSSIPEDERHTDIGFADDDAAVDAFLSQAGVSQETTEPVEPRSEVPAEGTTKEGVEPAEGEAEIDPNDPDEAEFEVKVGDKIEKAKLKDLKRLFGQEAALTQKSQKLAESQKMADLVGQKADTALRGLITKAQADYKQYADLDMLVLSQRMDTETFAQLRQDAAAAKANLDYLTTELEGVSRAAQERSQAAFKQAAAECIKALEDPTTGIEGFGKDLYEEMATFAESEGLKSFRGLTDAAAIKLLHRAMLYTKGEAARKTASTKVEKVVEQARRVLKPGNSNESKPNENFKDAVKRLRSTGSDDDAVAALMAMG